MELNHVDVSRASCWAGLIWFCCELNGQRSRLLATPLALYRPPEKLFYMPRYVHGVI